MELRVRVEPVIERHSPVQAVSHNEAHADVLHLKADEVIQFLTTHEGSRSMVRLYYERNRRKNESPCLIHRNNWAPPFSCQMCRTAWILTQVSKDMKARTQAFGKEEELRYYPNYNVNVEREWGYGTLGPIGDDEMYWWARSPWNHPAGDGHFSRDCACERDHAWEAAWDDIFEAFRAPQPLSSAPPPHVQALVDGEVSALHQMD